MVAYSFNFYKIGPLFNINIKPNIERVTEPCSRNYGGSYYWAGYIGKNSVNNIITTSGVVAQ